MQAVVLLNTFPWQFRCMASAWRHSLVTGCNIYPGISTAIATGCQSNVSVYRHITSGDTQTMLLKQKKLFHQLFYHNCINKTEMSYVFCYYHTLFSSTSFRHRPHCIEKPGFVPFNLGNCACEPTFLFSFRMEKFPMEGRLQTKQNCCRNYPWNILFWAFMFRI